MTDTYNTSAEIQDSRSWRNVIPPDPAALLLPRMKPEAIQALGENIKEVGQQTPVVIFADALGKHWLLDGISRLDGMVRVNLEVIKDGALNPEVVKFQVITGVDPVAYVLTANVHRRHLTTKDKRDLAGNLLRMFSSKSDRQIAEWISISHNTVKKVREELITSGQIDQICSRLDKKGRRRPASRPKSLAPSPKSETHIIPPHVPAAPGPIAPTSNANDLEEIARLGREIRGLLVHPTPDNLEGIYKRIATIIRLTGFETESHSKPPAASNAQLDLDAFGRIFGHAA